MTNTFLGFVFTIPSPIFWARSPCFILLLYFCGFLWESEPCPDDLIVYSDQTNAGWGLKWWLREGKWFAWGRALGQWLKWFPTTHLFLKRLWRNDSLPCTAAAVWNNTVLTAQRSYRVLCQAKGCSKSWPWFSWEGRRGEWIHVF